MSSFGYLIKEGFKNIFNNRMMSLASIGVLISCLVLTGSAVLLTVNVTNIVDSVSSTEEGVREEVRRACRTHGPQGYFIPSVTYGDPFGTIVYKEAYEIINDEIDRMSEEMFG